MQNLKVTLLHYTPLQVCASAIRTCWQSFDKSDSTATTCGEKDKALIERVGNKNKHSSTLEHLNYNFFISGISRACLQELARHRIASLSVKSTRYTLKELKDEESFTDNEINGKIRAAQYLVMLEDERVNRAGILALENLRVLLREGISNDVIKYALPESYKTELTWSINARSLQNFLQLRLSPHALLEIRLLAQAVLNAIPEDHSYLFEGLRVS